MASALTPAADSEPTTPEIDTTTDYHLSLYKYCFENEQKIGEPDTDTTFPGWNQCILNSVEGYMTYGTAETSIQMAGIGLSIHLGVSQGDVVMLLLPNSQYFVFAFLGLAYLGAVSAMGNPLDDPAEVQRKARAVGAKVVITTASYVEKVRLMAEEDGVRVVCVEEDNGPPPEFKSRQDGTTVPALFWYADILNIELTEYLSRLEDFPIKPDDAVAITYSTGSPTTITHRDMIASVAQYADGGIDNPNRYFHTDDVVLCAIPLFHIYSLVSVLCGIRVGAGIVILPKLGITQMLKLVQEHKVTLAPLVPDVVVAMRKSPVVDAFDLSSVKVVMLGEAVAPAEEEELQEAMRALMPNAKIGQVFDKMTGAGNITIDLANDPFEIEMEKLNIDDSEPAEEEIPEDVDEIPAESPLEEEIPEDVEEIPAVNDIPAIPLAELNRLTGDFGPEALVGKGPYGQIYQATLSSGQQVAIWVLEYLSEIISEVSEFYEDGSVYAKQLSILSRLKHDSWADLLCYCLESDTPILVYPFPTHGSLAEALHGKEDDFFQEEEAPQEDDDTDSRPVLTWQQRAKIACGVASGLKYLHEVADPPVVHGEFGTRNVLLFDDYHPKIASGFTLTSAELDKAFPDGDLGVLGYHAPEYVDAHVLTSKSDVYSFGVLLLELITGLKAIDPNRPQGEERLVFWARPMLNEELVMQCVDPKLNGEFPPKALVRMAAVAALCLQDDAEFRPTMDIVCKVLRPLLN